MTDQAADTAALTRVDHVRQHTSEEANRDIDRATEERVRTYAAQGARRLLPLASRRSNGSGTWNACWKLTPRRWPSLVSFWA